MIVKLSKNNVILLINLTFPIKILEYGNPNIIATAKGVRIIYVVELLLYQGSTTPFWFYHLGNGYEL